MTLLSFGGCRSREEAEARLRGWLIARGVEDLEAVLRVFRAVLEAERIGLPAREVN